MKYSTALKMNKTLYPLLIKSGILNIEGKENIPNNDKLTVFYGDHKSYLDPVLLIMTIQHNTDNDKLIVAPIYPGYMGYEPNPDKFFSRTIIESGYKHRNFLAKLGATPLFNRKDYDENLAKESFEEMQLLFERWKRMLIFPEGRIQREKLHQQYKTGMGRLVESVDEHIYFIPFNIKYKPTKVDIEFGKKFIIENEPDKYAKTKKLEDKVLDLQSGGI